MDKPNYYYEDDSDDSQVGIPWSRLDMYFPKLPSEIFGAYNQTQNLDDIPSCSGLSRQELARIQKESENRPVTIEKHARVYETVECVPEKPVDDPLVLEVLDQNVPLVVEEEERELAEKPRPTRSAVGLDDSDDDTDELHAVSVSPCGRYFKYGHQIGQGSVKAVYRGLDVQAGVPIAWCELLNNRLKKSDRRRFRDEADLLKQLKHPNILTFFSYWELGPNEEKNVVLVTEFMSSGTLKEYLTKFRNINLRLLKNWCVQILRGIQYLHTRSPPIIHRDLKCDNIFITGSSGRVKIGDLGLSTRKKPGRSKSIVGTPEFMAPEMYHEQYDEAVDIYAFGLCMFEMITNEYPYNECAFPTQIYKKVTSGVKPAGFEKIMDIRTRSVIEWCIQYDKYDRPTCEDLLCSQYFNDSLGFKLKAVDADTFINNPNAQNITYQFRILEPSKRIGHHQEDEAIQFDIDFRLDTYGKIAQELYERGAIDEFDRPLIEKILSVQVGSLQKEQQIIHKQFASTMPLQLNITPDVETIFILKPSMGILKVPKLSVTNVEANKIVYCYFDNNQLIMLFKFDAMHVNFKTLCTNMIKWGIIESADLLAFSRALAEIDMQIRSDPNALPSLDISYPGTSVKKQRDIIKNLSFAADTKPDASDVDSVKSSSSIDKFKRPLEKHHSIIPKATKESTVTTKKKLRLALKKDDEESPSKSKSVAQPPTTESPKRKHRFMVSLVPDQTSPSAFPSPTPTPTTPPIPSLSPSPSICTLPTLSIPTLPSTQVSEETTTTTTSTNDSKPPSAEISECTTSQSTVESMKPNRSEGKNSFALTKTEMISDNISGINENTIEETDQRSVKRCVNNIIVLAPIEEEEEIVEPEMMGQRETVQREQQEPEPVSTPIHITMPCFRESNQYIQPGQFVNYYRSANEIVSPQRTLPSTLTSPLPSLLPSQIHTTRPYIRFGGYTPMLRNPVPVYNVAPERVSLSMINPSLPGSIFKSTYTPNLQSARNFVCGVPLNAHTRQNLLLLLHKQNYEEKELRRKHLAELQEFIRSNALDLGGSRIQQWMSGQGVIGDGIQAQGQGQVQAQAQVQQPNWVLPQQQVPVNARMPTRPTYMQLSIAPYPMQHPYTVYLTLPTPQQYNVQPATFASYCPQQQTATNWVPQQQINPAPAQQPQRQPSNMTTITQSYCYPDSPWSPVTTSK